MAGSRAAVYDRGRGGRDGRFLSDRRGDDPAQARACQGGPAGTGSRAVHRGRAGGPGAAVPDRRTGPAGPRDASSITCARCGTSTRWWSVSGGRRRRAWLGPGICSAGPASASGSSGSTGLASSRCSTACATPGSCPPSRGRASPAGSPTAWSSPRRGATCWPCTTATSRPTTASCWPGCATRSCTRRWASSSRRATTRG